MFPKHVAIDPRLFSRDRVPTANEIGMLRKVLEKVKKVGCLVDDRAGRIRQAFRSSGLRPGDPRTPLLEEIVKCYLDPRYNRRSHVQAATEDMDGVLEFLGSNMNLDFVLPAGGAPDDLTCTPLYDDRFNLLISPRQARESGYASPAEDPRVTNWLSRALAGSRKVCIYDRYLLKNEAIDPDRFQQQRDRGRRAVARVLHAWLSAPAAEDAELTLQVFVGFDATTPGDGERARAESRAGSVRRELETLIDEQASLPVAYERQVRCQVFVRKIWEEDHSRYLASTWTFYLLPDGLDRLAPGGNPNEPLKLCFDRELSSFKESSLSGADSPRYLREDWTRTLPSRTLTAPSADSRSNG